MLKENKVKIHFKKDNKVTIKGKKYNFTGTVERKIRAPNFRGPFRGYETEFDFITNIYSWSNKVGDLFSIKISDFDYENAY